MFIEEFLKLHVMAKQHYGINDGYRGTVGTVIGYQWRGKWCLRSRPRFVRNPRTPKQMAARGIFSSASRLASRMHSVLRLGMRGEAMKMQRTECNHFMSLNAPCFSLVDSQLQVDYENLLVAVGPVAPVGFGTPTSDASLITIPFERNPLHLSSSSDDEVYLYAWCPELQQGILSIPAYRRQRQVTISLPDNWVGLEVHLYGFVTDYAGRASDSTYIGYLFADRHNNPDKRALIMENIDNKYDYETSDISGFPAGIQRNSSGSEYKGGGQGDSRRRQGGGTRDPNIHRD